MQPRRFWITVAFDLGKQRVETFQILKALRDESNGWRNHPATRMWDGYEDGLALYGTAICEEWIGRGYKDTMLERFTSVLPPYNRKYIEMPWWLGDEDFHISHQSNLVRKMPEFYEPQFPGVPNDLPYVWPVQERLVILA
jgi:hypothetical protein